MESGILIAYYSWSGNTEYIARLVANITGGDIFKIYPRIEYSGSYGECSQRAKREIRTGIMPELIKLPQGLNDYETLCIGSPIWYSTMAPPVAAFLSNADLAGRKIMPFCTHGGGRAGRFAADISRYCPDAQVTNMLEPYGSGGSVAESGVSGWIKENL